MTVTFWFDFASTYSYLSAMRIGPLAAARGVGVVWQPFLLGPVFAAQGWTSSPFNLYPAKGRNMWRDMERQTQAMGLALVRPDPFPQNSLLAARVALLAGEAGRGAAFCTAVFRAEFGQGRDISDGQVIASVLDEVGLSAGLVEQAGSPEVKAALRAVSERAAALDIYGAPSFTVDGELFWGNDRLEQALDWAAGARPGQG